MPFQEYWKPHEILMLTAQEWLKAGLVNLGSLSTSGDITAILESSIGF